MECRSAQKPIHLFNEVYSWGGVLGDATGKEENSTELHATETEPERSPSTTFIDFHISVRETIDVGVNDVIRKDFSDVFAT